MIEILEGNIGKSFSDINHSNIFLGQSPKAKEIKAKINKWDLKAFAQQRKPATKPMEKEKISTNDATNKGLISKNTNSSYNSISKKQTTQ